MERINREEQNPENLTLAQLIGAVQTLNRERNKWTGGRKKINMAMFRKGVLFLRKTIKKLEKKNPDDPLIIVAKKVLSDIGSDNI